MLDGMTWPGGLCRGKPTYFGRTDHRLADGSIAVEQHARHGRGR